MDDGLADDPTVDLDLPFELSGWENPFSHGFLQERILVPRKDSPSGRRVR